MAQMDGYLKKVAQLVSKHGWMVQGVLTSPSYSYTVGLCDKFQAPEIAIVGLDPRTARTVLNTVARRLTEGQLELVENTDFKEIFSAFPARFRRLPPQEVVNCLNVACAFSNSIPLAWQLIWPDPAGKFPGEPGVDEKYSAMQNLELISLSESGLSSH